MLQPIKRSRLRVYFGKKYYRLRRYLAWYFDHKKYAALREQKSLFPYLVFEHRTPLLRKLKEVDMWMQHNKVINLRIAAKRLNGVVIRPGETFSYWRLIGNPTSRKGYIPGMLLHYGNVTTGVGGGLCQLSNLIYWMTLHSPLTITERYRHSYDVFPDSARSQPFGSGATCAYNYLDLQITNDTSEPYQFIVELSDTHLVGAWRTVLPLMRTYEVYEKEHWITREFWGGYVRHNKIWRKAYTLENELVADEFITENHAIMMYEPMLEENAQVRSKKS